MIFPLEPRREELRVHLETEPVVRVASGERQCVIQRHLTSLALATVVGAVTVVTVGWGCARREPDPAERPRMATTSLPLRPVWLEGTATLTKAVENPTFQVTFAVRPSDFGSLEQALGWNSPCLSIALRQRCENGVEAAASPSDSVSPVVGSFMPVSDLVSHRGHRVRVESRIHRLPACHRKSGPSIPAADAM